MKSKCAIKVVATKKLWAVSTRAKTLVLIFHFSTITVQSTFWTQCLTYLRRHKCVFCVLVSQFLCSSMSLSMYLNAYVRRQQRSDRVKSVRGSFLSLASAYADVAVRFCHRQPSVGFHSLPVYIFRYKAAGCIGSR